MDDLSIAHPKPNGTPRISDITRHATTAASRSSNRQSEYKAPKASVTGIRLQDSVWLPAFFLLPQFASCTSGTPSGFVHWLIPHRMVGIKRPGVAMTKLAPARRVRIWPCSESPPLIRAGFAVCRIARRLAWPVRRWATRRERRYGAMIRVATFHGSGPEIWVFCPCLSRPCRSRLGRPAQEEGPRILDGSWG